MSIKFSYLVFEGKLVADKYIHVDECGSPIGTNLITKELLAFVAEVDKNPENPKLLKAIETDLSLGPVVPLLASNADARRKKYLLHLRAELQELALELKVELSNERNIAAIQRDIVSSGSRVPSEKKELLAPVSKEECKVHTSIKRRAQLFL